MPAAQSRGCLRERRAVPDARDREPPRRDRTFPPDPAFTAQANAKADLYAEAEADFEAFWARLARERIDWVEPFDTTLEWDLPFAKWFVGGKLNVAYNCVDRHVERGLGDKVAYHWVGEPGDTRTITFADLQREVSKAANALKELGVQTGDRVAIYMPMIPELPIAMLACARIGAPHTVVFGGFSAEALSRPHQRCAGQARHHRRRRLAARQGRPRSSRPSTRRSQSTPTDRARPRRPTPRRRARGRDRDARRPRRLVARHRRPPVGDCPSRSRSTASTCSTCSTPRARPPSPRASSTRPRATCSARASPTRWSSTSSPTTSTGAPPTSAG